MFIFRGWFIGLVLSIWVFSYPRWEMLAEDLVGKVVLFKANLACFERHSHLCTNEEYLIALRELYTPLSISHFPYSESHLFETYQYPTRDGTLLPIYVIRPKKYYGEMKIPIVLEFHLGGFVFGNEKDIRVAPLLAEFAQFLVFSPGYRLAPEFKFPTAPNDCMDALLWVRKNAKQWNGDLENVFLAGTSAGGNLAAATSNTAFQFPEKYGRIRGQILFYPLINFHAASPSFRRYWNTPLWNTHLGLASRAMYVPSVGDWTNPRASPVYGEKMKGFCKTFILVASHDPLRDDGLDYKAKLEKFGNEVVFVEHTTYHCGDLILGRQIGMGYKKDMAALIKNLMKFVLDLEG